MLRKSLRLRMCSPIVSGSNSYDLGINDLSEVRTYGKKATQLCPYGYLGHPNGKCHCTPDQIARYRRRISGPLLDRIDMQIEVPAVPQQDLMKQQISGKKKSVIRQRVEKSHQRQLDRQGKTNSRLSAKEIDRFCALDASSENLLKQAISHLNLSARAYHRILKVVRTIADLAGVEKITNQHIAEAVQYRRLAKY